MRNKEILEMLLRKINVKREEIPNMSVMNHCNKARQSCPTKENTNLYIFIKQENINKSQFF